MGNKLLAMFHPKNKGLTVEGEDGQPIATYQDENVPESEIWVVDANGTKVKTINLRGQDQKGEGQRGKCAPSRRR